MIRSDRDTLRTWFRSGELWIWANAAAVGISIIAIVGILVLLAVRGFSHFWPSDVQLITYRDDGGRTAVALGEIADAETLSVQQFVESVGGSGRAVPEGISEVERLLVKTGNRRYDPPDFTWIFTHQIDAVSFPEDAAVLERMEWGNAYGYLIAVGGPEEAVTDPRLLWETFGDRMQRAANLRASIEDIERGVLNEINFGMESVRLERRGIELRGADGEQTDPAMQSLDERSRELDARYETAERELRSLYQELQRDYARIELTSGQVVEMKLAEIVRAWRPNQMSTSQKLGHYLESFGLFLSEQPREANTEGGIFPAIFGTVLMVLLMSVLVTPFGVIAAVYLREYARQGAFVRLIRIAVNNLAGVPSIVYGVFGLGFFVYFIGGNLDQLFFPEALPAPTFGTPGLMWASLTLALLTVPVVVVSTEEGLTRIPRSIREGSLALGATKAETLFKVVLPMASPSILTGVILAVARAAGEVAPLMLVGVVKLAPTLPLDGNFPYLHLERKFMHLGFHIYDVGFQSPNVEAARPLVYATALLLVLI
ncbi:MAG: phosphate ABC transporter permease PstA, partial [Gammaproteobacteria bacterium]